MSGTAMCGIGGCIFVTGHGGDHFSPNDRLDHSDDIRIRILRDSVCRLDARNKELESALTEALRDTARLDFVVEYRSELWNTQLKERADIDAAMISNDWKTGRKLL